MTRFFAIPGLPPGDVIYWHQTYIDQEPELKFAGHDVRLVNKSPWIYLEEYPKLRREIQSVRPEYARDVNLGCFVHTTILNNLEAVVHHATRLVHHPEFVRMGYRVPETHESTVYAEPNVDTLEKDLQLLREVFVKQTDRCFLYRSLFPQNGYIVTEIIV